MRTINLIVLAFDSPVVRAYLAAMKADGFSPRKIIDLRIQKRGLGAISWKHRLAKRLLGQKLVGWVARWYTGQSLVKNVDEQLVNYLLKDISMRPNYFGSINYRDYSPEVETIEIKSINDASLVKKLEQEECETILFTGGGILEKEIISIPGKRFIHVHPGIVPSIRGSDGFFWSILLRGVPGTSCFYMNAGIDTGDVIRTREFQLPKFSLRSNNYSLEDIYNGLLWYFDPILRATLLMDVLGATDVTQSLAELPSIPQNPSEGRTYYLMHSKLRQIVINRLFVDYTVTEPVI